MKILIFGDIMGKVGRRAIAAVLPEWKKEYEPDLIIANGENLAHGKGITSSTVDELLNAGVDILTGGNHTFEGKDGQLLLQDPRYRGKLVRPGNYPAGTPGIGYVVREVGTRRVCVINLQGRVFMKVAVDDPLRAFDRMLAEASVEGKPHIVLVDFHGEATSERTAFGWYADSRATAVWGTHTHVPTADERILPGGTAYQTDVGMTGFADGVIGVKKEGPIKALLTSLPNLMELPDEGQAVVNALLVDADPKTGKATFIKRIQKYIEIR